MAHWHCNGNLETHPAAVTASPTAAAATAAAATAAAATAARPPPRTKRPGRGLKRAFSNLGETAAGDDDDAVAAPVAAVAAPVAAPGAAGAAGVALVVHAVEDDGDDAVGFLTVAVARIDHG